MKWSKDDSLPLSLSHTQANFWYGVFYSSYTTAMFVFYLLISYIYCCGTSRSSWNGTSSRLWSAVNSRSLTASLVLRLCFGAVFCPSGPPYQPLYCHRSFLLLKKKFHFVNVTKKGLSNYHQTNYSFPSDCNMKDLFHKCIKYKDISSLQNDL